MDRRSALAFGAAGAAGLISPHAAAADDKPAPQPLIEVLRLRPGEYHQVNLALPASLKHEFIGHDATRDFLEVTRLPDGKDVKEPTPVKPAYSEGRNTGSYPVTRDVYVYWPAETGRVGIGVESKAEPGAAVEVELRYHVFGVLTPFVGVYRVVVEEPHPPGRTVGGLVITLKPGQSREVELFWDVPPTRGGEPILSARRELSTEELGDNDRGKPIPGSDRQVGGGVTFTLNHDRAEELRKQLLADRMNDNGYRTTQACVVRVSVAADAKPGVVRVFVHWAGGTINQDLAVTELRVIVAPN
jgi:hypothetical protein